MKRKYFSLIGFSCALLFFGLDTSMSAQARFITGEDGLPAWISEVGARSEPKGTRIFAANAYGAVDDEKRQTQDS